MFAFYEICVLRNLVSKHKAKKVVGDYKNEKKRTTKKEETTMTVPEKKEKKKKDSSKEEIVHYKWKPNEILAKRYQVHPPLNECISICNYSNIVL